MFDQCPQLAPLGHEVCSELWKGSEFFDLKAGEYIWQQGQDVTSVFVLLEGTIVFSGIDQEGSETIFFPTYPVTFFGETEVILERDKYDNYSRALSNSKFASFKKQKFSELLQADPSYTYLWLQGMTAKAQGIKHMKAISVRKSPVQRVAGMILFAIEHKDSRTQDSGFVYTQDLLAGLVGLSRKAVNQVLTELSELGLIELSYRRINVLNMDKLREIQEAT